MEGIVTFLSPQPCRLDSADVKAGGTEMDTTWEERSCWIQVGLQSGGAVSCWNCPVRHWHDGSTAWCRASLPKRTGLSQVRQRSLPKLRNCTMAANGGDRGPWM